MRAYEYQKNYYLDLDNVIHFSIGNIKYKIYELNIQIGTTDSERISVQYKSEKEVLEAIRGLASATKAYEIDKNNFLILDNYLNLDNVKHFSLKRENLNTYELRIQIGTSAGEYISCQYRSQSFLSAKNEAEKSIKGLASAINERSVL